jgi:hypothetical protein
MKNITPEYLFNMLASRTGGIRWDDTVEVSRLEEGKSSNSLSAECYSKDSEETIAKVLQYLHSRHYITKQDNMHALRSIKGFRMLPEEKCINTYVSVNTGSMYDYEVSIHITGDPEECEAVMAWFKENFKQLGSTVRTAISINRNGGIEYDSAFMHPDKVRLSRQSFYPWLSVPIEEYAKAYMAAEESVLVMFGPPGTLKSTFLRTLIAYSGTDAILAFNESVIQSPELLRSYFNMNRTNILAYEDIDRHLGHRSDDNPMMSSLLNAADGVVQRIGKKLIFVTNLPNVDRIDEALLRQGRCYDILDFRLLTRDEAAAIRVDMKLPPMDFSSKEKWSGAEALSTHDVHRQRVNRFGNKLGFTNN